MRIIYTRAALADIDGIVDYLMLRNPRGAANVEADIQTAIGRLSVHPFSGRAQDEAGVRKAVSSRYRYRVFYAVDNAASVVQVLSILHPSRQS